MASGKTNIGRGKNLAGDNVATASSVSGTTLKLTPPKGFYDGATGTVNITDADFIADNIKTGINLFGKVGTRFLPVLSVGAIALASAPTLRTSQSGAFVKIKEITVPYEGTINWSYQWRYTYGTQDGLFDVRVNDVMIDRLTRNVTSGVFNVRNGTATLAAGDKIQIWFSCSVNGAGTGEIQSFSLTSNLPFPTVDLD